MEFGVFAKRDFGEVVVGTIRAERVQHVAALLAQRIGRLSPARDLHAVRFRHAELSWIG